MADLFSFLDGPPADEDDDSGSEEEIVSPGAAQAMEVDTIPSEAKKRREPDSAVDNGAPSPKRARREDSPAVADPVVVDEYNVEAKREVAASAGLTGSAEAAGGQPHLVLEHLARIWWFMRITL